MDKDNIHYYEDIIMMPRPISKLHPPISQIKRAAQFAPFAALAGHSEAIDESARITDEKKILDENKKVILDEKLQMILSMIKDHPRIKITYFKSDSKKDGGEYLVVEEVLKKFDAYHQILILMSGKKIFLKDIYELEIIDRREDI